MKSIQIKSEISVGIEELIQGVSQLDTDALELFIKQLSVVLARKKAPSLSEKESDLINRIHNSIPLELIEKSRKLQEKLQLETISELEYSELQAISKEIESRNVERLSYLITLSQLREVTLDVLMKQLDLKLPEDV